jgi:GNAT superfamily N-acetyltransferase
MTSDRYSLPRVRDEDLDAIVDLVARVQWPHRRSDLAFMMRLGSGRVVRDGQSDRAIGVGLDWTFAGALTRIGMIIISPDHQGQGIGRRLVGQLLDDARGRPVALLASEAGKPLYESMDFKTIGMCRQQQGVYGGSPVADPRVRAATGEDIAAITGLDAGAFGVDRTDALGALMDVGRTVVLTDGRRVTGYAVTRRFGHGSVIGPIVAAREDQAIALFKALAQPGFIRVDCPTDASDLSRHLTACGLTAIGADSPIMVRGDWTPPTAPHRIFALSSHALG